jgi:hypothetical protein
MTHRATRSLRHEYDLYVEREIEDYKDSVPRNVILSIGDEAVASLRAREQLELDEMVLWEEVDRIIKKRLRIPTYQTWRRRRLKMLTQYKQPEHWGLQPDEPLVRAITGGAPAESHVLVAGAKMEGAALFLAARGCEVTALEPAADAVERVLSAAEAAGLTSRVRGYVSDLGHWQPDVALQAVVCTPEAFAGLTLSERTHVIGVLQSATNDGGVHLVETIVAGRTAMTLDELRASYRGWHISVEREIGAPSSFLARKGTA